MSTETIDPRIHTEQLGRVIIESLFPHGGPGASTHKADRQVPPEALLMKVEGAQDVKDGDVILVVEDSTGRTILDRYSAREALNSYSAYLALVTKVSSKSLVATVIRQTRRHGFTVDLDNFGEPASAASPERLMFSRATREIGRVGSLKELREKIAAHPQLEEWRTARAAAVALDREKRETARVAAEAQKARVAPIRAAVERINELARMQLLTMWSSDVSAVTEWLAEKDFIHLRVYLCGLNAVGTMTDAQQVEALRHLDTIIAYAKGKK
ncbi:hypothetical protein AB0E08_08390 [Streptomyces sp. NPDC048281]|uniref:hypothetical protein n=1 Tax=Streptomyces sp. NPDC048281 TaxID=3154715 RepID=UPI00341E68AB